MLFWGQERYFRCRNVILGAEMCFWGEAGNVVLGLTVAEIR